MLFSVVVDDETASWFFFPPSTGLLVSFMNEKAYAGDRVRVSHHP